jgi:ATP-dependent protease ClpP protease subunit
VEGCAASGASFISTAGTKRLIRKSSYMLIHELSDLSWGRHSEMEDNVASNRDIMITIKNWYKERTKIPAKQLDEILTHDIWWNAKKCLKYGLVDGII